MQKKQQQLPSDEKDTPFIKLINDTTAEPTIPFFVYDDMMESLSGNKFFNSFKNWYHGDTYTFDRFGLALVSGSPSLIPIRGYVETLMNHPLSKVGLLSKCKPIKGEFYLVNHAFIHHLKKSFVPRRFYKFIQLRVVEPELAFQSLDGCETLEATTLAFTCCFDLDKYAAYTNDLSECLRFCDTDENGMYDWRHHCLMDSLPFNPDPIKLNWSGVKVLNTEKPKLSPHFNTNIGKDAA